MRTRQLLRHRYPIIPAVLVALCGVTLIVLGAMAAERELKTGNEVPEGNCKTHLLLVVPIEPLV